MIYCRVYDMDSSGSESVSETDNLQLYAVLNVHETPRKLLSRDDCKYFHCHFALPLPRQVIVFALGDWEGNVGGSIISVEVSLESEQLPKKIGTLTNNNRALCWQAEWGKNFTRRSIELMDEDRMAKLVLSVVEKENQQDNKKLTQKVIKKENQTSPKTPFSKAPKSAVFGDKANAKHVLTPKNRNTKLDEFWGTLNGKESEVSPQVVLGTPLAPPSVDEGRRKRTPRSSSQVPAMKRRKSLHQTEYQDSGSSPSSRVISSPNAPTTPGTPRTPSSPSVTMEGVPSSRWGHAMCQIDDDRVVLIGGQGPKYQMVKDSLWVLSLNSVPEAGVNEWSQPVCQDGTGADRRMGHTICYDSDSKALYVYGGSKNKRWFSDVHKLDTSTWTWSALQTVGKAPSRSYHSCTLFRGELWVIGGVYPIPDPQPDGCSNDVYVLNLNSKNWYMPITGGDKPCPRSGHSARLLDDLLVIFGGWDAPACYNDLFLLDLTIMEFTKPTITGNAPSPRSWHTAVTLPGKRMIIHGGYNGTKIVDDAFIFDLGMLTWTRIQTPIDLCPRAGHAAFYLVAKDDGSSSDAREHQIAIFGGGDNLGGYFNDLVLFTPQT